MKQKILTLLKDLNAEYKGNLITVDIESYVSKIIDKSTIISIVENNNLHGFISYYQNDKKKENAFLTIIGVDKNKRNKGYGKCLLDFSISSLQKAGFKKYGLEVLKENHSAISMYKKSNFKIVEDRGTRYFMELELAVIN